LSINRKETIYLYDYPKATAFIDSHFYVFDVNPPNDLEVMKLYVEAFEKVMDNVDKLVE
jgi:hypothetical protein